MKKHWIIALILLTVATIVAEFLMHHDPHHHHWWNSIPLFFIFFGFLGTGIIVAVAKTTGKLMLYKKEDYYNGE